MKSRFLIRTITDVKEFKRCEDLQRECWGFDDLDIVPAAMFVIGARYGGIVLGGFDRETDRMVGFVYSLPARLDGRWVQYSHMLAVVPELRRHGLGVRLKLAQGRASVRLGFRELAWTFDPLQARNANLNLHRLGAVSKDYLRNLYGETSSPLHKGLATDRLLARWSPGKPAGGKRSVGRLPVASDVSEIEPGWRAFRVPIPASIEQVKHADPAAAAYLQQKIRAIFEHSFRAGYAAVDFHLVPHDGHGFYVMERKGAKR